jgi:hypothetical protein
LKFTDKGGTVTFKVINFPINEEGYIGFRIHIKDTGIGMSEEFQKRIFQSFERENTATVSGVQGTGLGLAITKSLVELLGGSILFTSELGKGTEFVITFRAKVAEKPEDVYLEEVDDFISLNGIKVLVVEDNELNREIVTEILESEGVIVTSVEDGSQAVNIIDESKEDELTKLLDNELKNNFEHYIQKLYTGIDTIIATHDKVVPKSKMVMGEGATYCASPTLAFERDSEHFWRMLRIQMNYFNEKGFWGTVLSTTHAPERIVAWDACKDLYLEANRLFLNEK